MGFRDDEAAVRARATALEQRVRDLEVENAKLRTSGGAPEPLSRSRLRRATAAVVVIALVVVGISVGVAFFASEGDLPPDARAMIVTAAVALVAMSIVPAILVERLVEIARPDEVLIVIGRRSRSADGQERSYRVASGRVLRVPIVELVQRLDTSPLRVERRIDSVYLREGQRAQPALTASVRIARREPLVHSAIERFLGQSPEKIARTAGDTLESAARSVLSKLVKDELRDGEKLRQAIIEEAEKDLAKLGLELDDLSVVVEA
jgi:uncharacterized membrane protein YqiK